MTLSDTWFLEGFVDFELQKYRLLAYLQETNRYFNETKLYPQLADVIFHYNNLVAFKDNKQFLQNQFPKHVNKIDMQKLELVYENMLADNGVMQELEHIARYAINEMKQTIDNGAEIYEFVEKQLKISPVGIMPLYKDEGYVLLRFAGKYDIRAYAYTLTLFEHADARYKGIKFDYLESWNKGFINTYEQIKLDIVRTKRALPNPAVYSMEFPLSIPLDETLLPVARRMLIKYISSELAA